MELALQAPPRTLMTQRVLMAGLAWGLIALPAAAAGPDDIPLYRAAYEVEYKGRHIAHAEFRVSAEGGDRFVFDSSTKARLLLRIAAPNPAIEHSEFRLDAGQIRPIAFSFEDGSRDGDDNYRIEFDTEAGQAHVSGKDGTRTETLSAGVLDRGSMQVVMMRDLARCTSIIGPYHLIDDEGVDTYDVERLDDQTADTGIGEIETRRYRQHREGSSRETIIWAAPEYAYLPVRIEQWRDGELQTSFTLDELDGLERRPDTC